MINKDSTFSYYDWWNGSCWAQVNENGFININNDTLILISNGMCFGFDCLEVVFKEYTDTTKVFFSFDQELKKKFPDLKVSFDVKFEEQYDIDNENNLIIDLKLYDGFVTPLTIHLRSKNFNSDIELHRLFRFINMKTDKDRTVHDNFASIRLNPDYEKLIQKQEIFVKYLITQSGDLKSCDNINSLAAFEMKKRIKAEQLTHNE